MSIAIPMTNRSQPGPTPAVTGPAPRESGSAGSGTASVLRALQLLDVFTAEKPVLGVSDIARRAGLPTSTVHRLLSHLVKGNIVTKEESSYRLSDRLFELGNRVAHSGPSGLKETAAPFLGELFGGTGLTTHLAVLDGPEIIMVDKVVGLRSYPSRTVIGGRYPAVCTALGKALLAFEPEADVRAVLGAGMPRRTRFSQTDPARLLKELAQVRSSRIAHDREEASLGQTCVAAPVLSHGRAVAAISLSGPARSFDPVAHGPVLVRATAQLAARLG